MTHAERHRLHAELEILLGQYSPTSLGTRLTYYRLLDERASVSLIGSGETAKSTGSNSP